MVASPGAAECPTLSQLNECEAFVYEFGSDKKREAANSNTQTYWQDTYDSKRRLLFQEPRASMSSTTASSWYRRDFYWDNDGRMSFSRETVVPYYSGGQWGWLPGQAIDLTANNGFGSVYSQMLVNGAAYQYFYDAQGRRSLKMYPNGATDEFFYDGEHLIEDRGLTSPQAVTLTYPIDQYVWLGNMPIAVIRQYFNSSMVRQTSATDCTRNDESAPCGTFHIVNDYLPKPVVLVNSAGKLSGIGEYDTFGRVNRVALRVDALGVAGAGGWPFGTYSPASNATLATFSPTLRGGLQGRGRFDYSLVNAASGHSTWIASGATCATAVSPSYSGQISNFSTPWFSLFASTQYCLKWNAPGGSSTLFGGVVTKGYSYQNYETGASPTWIPLRFPGQYEDAETGLYENWNRFYDAPSGRYVTSEPRLLTPNALDLSGVAQPYTYSRNDPLTSIDPDDLDVINRTKSTVAVKPGSSNQKYRIKHADGTVSEEMTTGEGAEGDASPIELAAGDTLVMEQDGVAVPDGSGSVFKTTDGYDAIVSENSKGGFEISAQPGEKLKSLLTGPAVSPQDPRAAGIGLYLAGRNLNEQLRAGWKPASWTPTNWKPLSNWSAQRRKK